MMRCSASDCSKEISIRTLQSNTSKSPAESVDKDRNVGSALKMLHRRRLLCTCNLFLSCPFPVGLLLPHTGPASSNQLHMKVVPYIPKARLVKVDLSMFFSRNVLILLGLTMAEPGFRHCKQRTAEDGNP
jgi:hypothetical protein